MEITILCSNAEHPVMPFLSRWASGHSDEHNVSIKHCKMDLMGGDILFLISCGEYIESETRQKYSHTLILHASDLPEGRGWSPHVWSLVGGAEDIVVTMLEAEDGIDTGPIWAKRSFYVPKHALFNEVNTSLFNTELALMDDALQLIGSDMEPQAQRTDIRPTYNRKRTPEDSRVDPSASLEELFNKIRLMDPERYPAYFQLHGHTFNIRLEKVSDDEKNSN